MVLRAVLAALAVAVLAACGDGDDASPVAGQTPATTVQAGPATTGGGVASTSTTAGTVLSVSVQGGVVEGASRQRAPVNQPVTIRVTSDVADEMHVHGYDKRVEVAPGRTAEVTFLANIPGVFEVEFERSHRLLFSLEVR